MQKVAIEEYIKEIIYYNQIDVTVREASFAVVLMTADL